ncbi:MAG TPA: FkbM family methyltransferase [Crenalkalicoccus sp.]|nr:FkbM family methyltransferase [Crenalkalicoccus sp.]
MLLNGRDKALLLERAEQAAGGLEAQRATLAGLEARLETLGATLARIADAACRQDAAASGAEARLALLAEGSDRLLAAVDRQRMAASDMEARLARLEHRVEEIVAYFAIRANALLNSRATYLGDHTAIAFLESGLRIYVDTRSQDIGAHLLTLGAWERDYTTLFTRLIRPGDTILDLGANHGVYTLLGAAATGPAGRVHAFEANPRLAALALRSVQLNGFAPFVTVHALGVGAAAGEMRLVVDEAWSGGGALRGDGEGTPCRVVSLDEHFADPGFRVDVMKMDIEGGEGLALRGMRGLLDRSPRLRILMEFAPAMLRGSGVRPGEVAALLEGCGFRPWSVRPGGALEETGWPLLLAQPDGVQNILLAREDPGLA